VRKVGSVVESETCLGFLTSGQTAGRARPAATCTEAGAGTTLSDRADGRLPLDLDIDP
jgi:hypothetical protein